MRAFNNASIFVLVSSLWMNSARGFTTSPVATTTSTSNPCTSITRLDEKPGWLDDAMEGIPSGEFDAESYRKGIDLKSGIAGFSTHPELGFVCILATKNESADEQHWIPAVISPVDKDRPKSAEALTCVQLAGGLDLGTAILPPGCLTKLVKDHTSEEEDSDEISSTARLSLKKVTALPNPEANDATINIEEETQEIVATTPERDEAILEAVPKVEKAIKTLPGLKESTTEDVTKAVCRFADSNGKVDRTAFSSILDALREANSPSTNLASPVFRMDVSVIDEGGISQASIETSNAMVAIGLSMRYKVTVDIEEIDQHSQGGTGKDAVFERFPVFRPIQELNEDSKVIDGFIPSMFGKSKLDNDMKSDD
mmetsp:Transcript_12359/g.25527  ORF Transcript_12359/g.25527 Transcript_12359/m.25527 type:complete len:369 (-) Transcript_12359:1211-2317(-)